MDQPSSSTRPPVLMPQEEEDDLSEPYHYKYTRAAIARLPPVPVTGPFMSPSSKTKRMQELEEEVERDEMVLPMMDGILTDEDMKYLRENTAHISFTTVLEMLPEFCYDVEKVVEVCSGLKQPQLLCKYTQQLFLSSCAVMKRRVRNSRYPERPGFRTFHMTKMFKCNDFKTLVKFYYDQKGGPSSFMTVKNDRKYDPAQVAELSRITKELTKKQEEYNARMKEERRLEKIEKARRRKEYELLHGIVRVPKVPKPRTEPTRVSQRVAANAIGKSVANGPPMASPAPGEKRNTEVQEKKSQKPEPIKHSRRISALTAEKSVANDSSSVSPSPPEKKGGSDVQVQKSQKPEPIKHSRRISALTAEKSVANDSSSVSPPPSEEKGGSNAQVQKSQKPEPIKHSRRISAITAEKSVANDSRSVSPSLPENKGGSDAQVQKSQKPEATKNLKKTEITVKTPVSNGPREVSETSEKKGGSDAQVQKSQKPEPAKNVKRAEVAVGESVSNGPSRVLPPLEKKRLPDAPVPKSQEPIKHSRRISANTAEKSVPDGASSVSSPPENRRGSEIQVQKSQKPEATKSFKKTEVKVEMPVSNEQSGVAPTSVKKSGSEVQVQKSKKSEPIETTMNMEVTHENPVSNDSSRMSLFDRPRRVQRRVRDDTGMFMSVEDAIRDTQYAEIDELVDNETSRKLPPRGSKGMFVKREETSLSEERESSLAASNRSASERHIETPENVVEKAKAPIQRLRMNGKFISSDARSQIGDSATEYDTEDSDSETRTRPRRRRMAPHHRYTPELDNHPARARKRENDDNKKEKHRGEPSQKSARLVGKKKRSRRESQSSDDSFDSRSSTPARNNRPDTPSARAERLKRLEKMKEMIEEKRKVYRYRYRS